MKNTNFIPVKFSNGYWSIEIKYNIQFVIRNYLKKKAKKSGKNGNHHNKINTFNVLHTQYVYKIWAGTAIGDITNP